MTTKNDFYSRVIYKTLEQNYICAAKRVDGMEIISKAHVLSVTLWLNRNQLLIVVFYPFASIAIYESGNRISFSELSIRAQQKIYQKMIKILHQNLDNSSL